MADKATTLQDHLTDPNQQVQIFIVSADHIEGDLFDVEGKFSDGSKCKGEMLSNGGVVPVKDAEFKLQIEKREVPVAKPKKGEPKTETRDVVVGYRM